MVTGLLLMVSTRNTLQTRNLLTFSSLSTRLPLQETDDDRASGAKTDTSTDAAMSTRNTLEDKKVDASCSATAGAATSSSAMVHGRASSNAPAVTAPAPAPVTSIRISSSVASGTILTASARSATPSFWTFGKGHSRG